MRWDLNLGMYLSVSTLKKKTQHLSGEVNFKEYNLRLYRGVGI